MVLKDEYKLRPLLDLDTLQILMVNHNNRVPVAYLESLHQYGCHNSIE